MKQGDLIRPREGHESSVWEGCRQPHRYDHEGSVSTDFICTSGETHQFVHWEVEPPAVEEPVLRRIGDFSSYPATRIEYASGASKGMRVTRQDLIPPEALLELSAVYGFGELKYPAGPDGPNWMRGLNYSACVRALKDHISEWELGKDYDDEDGVSPLAHAMWHLCALLTFQARGLGTDDRPFKRVDP
jgi:hypothetical protein